MEKSLIAAFKSMLTMQRWNLHPRVETWVEAENAVLRAHLAYAIHKGGEKEGESPVPKPQIIHLLLRTLLKPLNKHFLTDISVFVTRELKENEDAWKSVVENCAKDTENLFPREIREITHNYLSDKKKYTKEWPKNKWGEGMEISVGEAAEKEMAKVIKFCKYRVQEQECKINRSIYGTAYEPFFTDEIEKELDIEKGDKGKYYAYYKIIEENNQYFDKIVSLKYLRRWNTINLFVSSSVLGHTYIVTILALVFSLMEFKKGNLIAFVYEVLLRSLFHDVPEAVTGDIITPVKDRIKKEFPRTSGGKDIIAEIEEKLTADKIITVAPQAVGKEIAKESPGLDLFKGLTNKDASEGISLVKDCDRLSLMLECLYEKEAGVISPEMEETYHKYRRELSNSEWPSVRRFLDVLSDQWRLSD